jgi:hypothetical protein
MKGHHLGLTVELICSDFGLFYGLEGDQFSPPGSKSKHITLYESFYIAIYITINIPFHEPYPDLL